MLHNNSHPESYRLSGWTLIKIGTIENPNNRSISIYFIEIT